MHSPRDSIYPLLNSVHLPGKVLSHGSDDSLPVQKNGRRGRIRKLSKMQIKLPFVRPPRRMVESNELRSLFHHISRHDLAAALYPTADLRLAFQDGHLVSKTFQFVSGRQPTQPTSDHDNFSPPGRIPIYQEAVAQRHLAFRLV